MTRTRIIERVSDIPLSGVARPRKTRGLRSALRRMAAFARTLRRDEAVAHQLRKRLAVLVLALAVPAMAAPGDLVRFTELSTSDIDAIRLLMTQADPSPMPFEEPGMSFPGSAFYFLADPPARAALIALPGTDPLGRGDPGRTLDPGPAAAPFLAAAGSTRAAHCLAEAIYHEAASESEAGQRAVAQVVLNRVRHPAWPNSVCAVVFQGSGRATGCQFTFTCDGSRARVPGGAAWARAQRIARAALGGEVYAPIGLATHYHTHWVAPRWAASLDHVGSIGAHRFYRARGTAGTLAAFDAAYAGLEPEAPARIAALSAHHAAAPAGIAAAVGAQSDVAIEGPAASAPATAQGEPAEGRGSVRAEYRSAGRWKEQPEARLAEDRPVSRIKADLSRGRLVD